MPQKRPAAGRRYRGRPHLERLLHPGKPVHGTWARSALGRRGWQSHRRRRSQPPPRPRVSRTVDTPEPGDSLDGWLHGSSNRLTQREHKLQAEFRQDSWLGSCCSQGVQKGTAVVAIIFAVVVVGLLITVSAINRGERQAVMEVEGAMLRGLNKEYTSMLRDPLKVQQLLVPNGSFHPVIFTNVLRIGGTNYGCQFAVNFVSFGKPGTLIVATNDILLFLDKANRATVVSFP